MEMPPYGSRGKLPPGPPTRTFPPLPQGLENAPQTPTRVSHIPTAPTAFARARSEEVSEEPEPEGVVKVGVH